MADLYQILGVDRSATEEEIKRAYRRRARELHPDAGGDEAEFKELTRAYEVLSDPSKRRRYDAFGDEGPRRAGGDPFGFGAEGFGGLSDVIDAFFGGGGGGFGGFTTAGGSRRRTSHQPGRDVAVAVEVGLEDLVEGVEREVEVEVASVCGECDGSGSRGDGGSVRCPTCGGAGQVQRVMRSAFGQIATARPCPDCRGSGGQIGDPCPGCHGEGRRTERRRVTVQVPAGVEHGDRLRVAGHGEAGRRGARSGDMYVEVHVAPHDTFTRDGRDIWCDISVPLVHAALGAKLQIPTIDGDEETLDLPAGSQPGDVFVIRGAGMPARGGYSRGAMKVRLQVEVPRSLTTEQRELLERFAELRGEEAPPSGKGLFDRLREAFR